MVFLLEVVCFTRRGVPRRGNDVPHVRTGCGRRLRHGAFDHADHDGDPVNGHAGADMAVDCDDGPMGDDGRHRLIGRGDELDRLVRLFDAPPSAVVLVVGEAGIGKTELLATALRSIGSDVRRVLVRTPLVPERRFSLWSSVAQQLDVALPDTDRTVGSAEQVAELAGLLGDALAGLGRAVIAIEDLHRADPWSVEVLELLPALVDPTTALVATSRPTDGHTRELETSARLVRLGPLDAEHIGEIVADLTGRPAEPDELARIVAGSGGNPLLARELALDPDRGRRSRATGAVIGSLLDRLPAAVREATELLALAGPGTPDPVVAAALGCERDELERRWRAAIDADVLAVADGGVAFRHDLLAETAVAEMQARHRRDLHRRLADGWGTAPRPDELRVARHLVGATAPGAGAEIVDRIRATAADLARMRRHADAADLLDEFSGRFGDDLPPRDAALVAADLGDVLHRAGLVEEAVTSFERAAQLARPTDDVELRARAEVGRQRRANLLMPDPDGRATLAAIGAELAARGGDSAVRVAVLGRRAALALQPPPDSMEAVAFAEQGVAMARRLGDPDALLGALEEWGLAIVDPEDVDRLEDAAAELMALALHAERRDLLLTAYEWRFVGRLRHGDLDGAERTVREVEALASVSTSPMWQITALQRRMLVQSLRGDRAAASELVGEIAALGARFLDPVEVRAIQIGPRASMSIVYGSVDPDVVELQRGVVADFDAIPAPFIQIAIAALEVVLGDDDGGLRRAERWLRTPEVASQSPNPPTTLGLLALLARRLGDAAVAEGVRRELARFGGRLASQFDHGTELPVDHHLAGLDLVVGDFESAGKHAHAAVRFARSMGSPVLEAVCLARLAEAQAAAGDARQAAATHATAEGVAERVGVLLDPPWSRPRVTPVAPGRGSRARPSGAATAELLRDADGWHLVVDDERRTLPDLAGMRMLARLLTTPDVDVGADELAGRHRADAPPVESDLGPALDARAKREYRGRIAELQDDILDAEADHDLERIARARAELDLLIDELQRAAGLGGRDRPQRSSNERDRINVTRNLGRAVTAIERVHAGIGGHLRAAVGTGHRCVYRPDPTAAIRLAFVDRR